MAIITVIIGGGYGSDCFPYLATDLPCHAGAMTAFVPYSPLNQPKPFDQDIWIVDEPEIRMD